LQHCYTRQWGVVVEIVERRYGARKLDPRGCSPLQTILFWLTVREEKKQKVDDTDGFVRIEE